MLQLKPSTAKKEKKILIFFHQSQKCKGGDLVGGEVVYEEVQNGSAAVLPFHFVPVDFVSPCLKFQLET